MSSSYFKNKYLPPALAVTLFVSQLFNVYSAANMEYCAKALLKTSPGWYEHFNNLIGKPISLAESGSKKIDGDVEYIAHGIPDTVKLHPLVPAEIFRHYSSPENIEAIIKGRKLIAGNLPYVVTSRGVRTSFVDLTGIFLTKPGFSPQQVGVEKNKLNSFIDLRLPSGTEVIQLEPGIFLVPGPAKIPEWIANYYGEWKLHPHTVPGYVRTTMMKLDEQGGILTPVQIPIILLN
jgi:hypothetical protein